jgi:hypothetical protein
LWVFPFSLFEIAKHCSFDFTIPEVPSPPSVLFKRIPGFEGFEKYCEVDIAAQFAQYIKYKVSLNLRK